MLLRNEIFHSRNKLVAIDPNKTPKLQNAWKTDIIDLFSRFSTLEAYKLNDKLIGYGGLVHNSWINQRSEISFIINPDLVENEKNYIDMFSNFIKLIYNSNHYYI